MGVPINGREKSFQYGDRRFLLRWEMEPVSGGVQLVVLRQEAAGTEWWIVHRLGPFWFASESARYPGGIPAYLKEKILPQVNADIQRLVTSAVADAGRDPVTGTWPSSKAHLDALLQRSIDVNVAEDGMWALRANY